MNEFIIGPQVSTGDYYDTTLLAKARQHGEACPAVPPTDENGLNSFVLLQYYDLPLSLYTAYQRSGDTSFLALARKCADAWWMHPQWIGSGSIRLFPDQATPAPRHAGIGGLLLRAIDDRSEMFDWINAYVRAAFDLWVKRRLTSSELHYGLREGAFALRYACWLVKTLPDAFPLQAGGVATNGAQLRAQYLNDIETACVQYFGRLQHPDGSWRWNTTPDEPRDDDGGTWVGIMQPFMVGLLLRALIDAHQIVTTETVKENIKNQILKACRHLYADGAYSMALAGNFNVTVRGFNYFFHGGTSVNPTKYQRGDIPHPWLTTERWHVESARQAISTVVGAFGYAYKISGDPVYKLAGNELYDSAYSGADGFRSMMADTSKNFNQHIWSSSYKAWLGEAIPAPNPTPTPAPPDPTPAPEPVFPPSPDGTKGVEIFDSNNGQWTLGIERQTLRNGVHMGSGAGFTYKWTGGIVYVLGMDNKTWYKWVDKWVEIGQQEPAPMPAPTPAPAPAPAPVPPPIPEYKIEPFNGTESGRTATAQRMWALGYGYWSETDADVKGNKIKFRRLPNA